MILQDIGFSDTAGTPESMETMVPTDWNVSVPQPPYSMQEIAFSPMQDVAYPPQDRQFQFVCNINATFDPPMAFRDRHRFLDEIYSSYPDPDLMSAKILDNVSQCVGLSMEEVLSWFGDEKSRRARLFANNDQFPLSPPRTTTPANSIATTMTVPNCISSPAVISQMDDVLSPFSGHSDEWLNGSEELAIGRAPAPARAKRGRPAKNRFMSQDRSLPEVKRAKQSKYPCPDCDNILAADRWSEHVKRVHFPDQVWECSKINQRTRKPCRANPFFRPDNFATHLRGEHACGAEEISNLKESCKFRTRYLFHQICGFCDETFENRDDSIEHIKSHFRDISERNNPPADYGASEWKEKCKSNHELKRGIHYHVDNGASHGKSDQDEDHDDDSGASGHGSFDVQPHDHSQSQQADSANDSAGNSSGFYSSQDPNYMNYQRYSRTVHNTIRLSAADLPPPKPSIIAFGEVLHLPSADAKFAPEGGFATGSNYGPLSLSRNSGPPSYSSYPNPPPQMSGLVSGQSFDHQDDLLSDEPTDKGRCTYPECGRTFKDLKAHTLTHQNDRPEKCPILTCDYHVKGFARKYDKNRHTLTHYKGTMVCGFCPGSGSPAEKSFNRADVFKRHLTSIHAVEQTPLNGRMRPSASTDNPPSRFASDRTANCSTCSLNFSNAQDFYEHLDECVLKTLQLEEPSAAIKARQLAEVEQHHAIHETLNSDRLPTVVESDEGTEEAFETEADHMNEDDFSLRLKSSPRRKNKVHTISKGGTMLKSHGLKKPTELSSRWGC